MAEILNSDEKYFRKNNIICYTGTEFPIIAFKQNFIDLKILSEDAIQYVNKYCEMFPDLIYDPKKQEEKQNIMQQKEESQQLSFF